MIVIKITIMGIGSAPCPLLYLDYLIRLGDNGYYGSFTEGEPDHTKLHLPKAILPVSRGQPVN